MDVLKKLHAELLDIENRFHALADPEKAIAEKVREVVKAAVDEVVALRGDFDALVTAMDRRFMHLENVAPVPEQPPASGEQSPGADAYTDAGAAAVPTIIPEFLKIPAPAEAPPAAPEPAAPAAGESPGPDPAA